MRRYRSLGSLINAGGVKPAFDPDAAILRWMAIDPEALYAPVRSGFPVCPAPVLDVGAGSGRDAIWLLGQGHSVTCVEPHPVLRARGQSVVGGAQWIDCALPDLVGVSGRFDLILVGAVWHVLEEDQHADAFCRLAELLADKGRLIVSLKQAENTPVIMDEARIAAAGLEVQQVAVTPSIQAGNHALGVMWEWKVLRPKAVGQRS